jgi:CubicO group peptidase (beta-lactamase class C family)
MSAAPVEIKGFCDRGFAPLRDAFRANYDDGLELGSSLALTHRGKLVVDLWAGFADPEQRRTWDGDTIAMAYSTTKIMAALCALLQVDRRLLKLDEPVALYWPEFAQGGKEHITVRDAFTHQAGVPGFATPVPFELAEDWNAFTAHIAAEPHWFGGKRMLCYHAMTYGSILGELVRRVDGRRTAQFFREEFAEPLGIDFQIGLSAESEMSRLATPQVQSSGPRFPEGSLAARVVNSVAQPSENNFESLSADIPSGLGFGNGRSVAQVCAIFANGKLGGTQYLSEQMIREVGTEQVSAQDPVVGPLRFGLGLALDSNYFPAPSKTCIHWGGFGGSWGIADPKTRVSFGYVPNNLIVETEGDSPVEPRLRRLSDALAAILSRL